MGHNHAHAVQEGKRGDERYQATRNVTVIGAVVNLLLSIGKVVIGVVGGSPALVADGIHSLSDLLTDVMVVWAAKHGSKDADEDHPYGHGRIETVFTVGLGVVLLLVAGGILVDAVSRLFHPERLTHPGMAALVMAAISVVAKELLYHYTLRVARRIRSNLLKANAWHHRSDAISSIVVIVGIAGTMAGLPYLDAIAAIVVSMMIARIGWELGWSSVNELVDRGLDADRVEAIRRAILSVDGVLDIHMLRTRRMGGEALADVHILVPPRISVSEGHFISEAVRRHVIGEVDEVQDVLVHIDPEDDEQGSPSQQLPGRSRVREVLEQAWQDIPEASHVERMTLHYIGGKIAVDVTVPLTALASLGAAEALRKRMQAPFINSAQLGPISVSFF